MILLILQNSLIIYFLSIKFFLAEDLHRNQKNSLQTHKILIIYILNENNQLTYDLDNGDLTYEIILINPSSFPFSIDSEIKSKYNSIVTVFDNYFN